MPAKRLEVGRRARADLAAIRRFSVKRWDRDQADRYGDELNAAMVGLADGTRIGHAAVIDDYRVLRCKAHMIYYREQATRVQVVRVLHAHQLADSNL